jgi:hypothetical protein
MELNMTPEQQAAADQAAAAEKEAVSDQAATTAAAAAPAAAEAPKGKTTQARVLLDCDIGKADDVVNLTAAELKALEAAGKVDSHASAVKYALGLKSKADAAAKAKQKQDQENAGQ